MSRLLLVRHAHAGDRGAWVGDDALRPLSARGSAQATALAALLAPLAADPAAAVVSSPALRCTATVAPLAARLGTDVRVESTLGEGADAGALLDRVAGLAAPTVWSSHGDVIPALLLLLAARGVDLGVDPTCRKASTWVLELADGRVTAARHLPPPDVSG
ncbi:MAG: histidine phosphatase family protein [Nitriliruptoraceae bacterium]|jgi:phosphohistidine phosphatase SixA